MTQAHLFQFGFMIGEALFVGLLIVFLFRLRHKFGNAILYISLGVFQHMQTTLAASVYFELLPGISVSPGSAVLFNASLFAILLVYIREDQEEARKLINGLIFANVTLTIFTILIGMHIGSDAARALTETPTQYFILEPIILFVGTLILVVDAVLIVVIYEYFARYIHNLLLRIYCSMALVLLFDSVLFVTASFWSSADYGSILISSLVGKLLMSIFYSIILATYLRYFEREEYTLAREGADPKHVIGFLTYRQKYEILRKEIFRDALTGLYNRGFLNENLPRELERARRIEEPVAFLMIDIDHFKAINDDFGHQEGDKVIQYMATVLADMTRKTDLACRYGGEEFAVILPQTAQAVAIILANRIRENMATFMSRLSPPFPREITVTIGVALAPDDATTPEQLIAVADRRLYIGKRGGRDCVVSES